ncbi:MAG: YceI family protein [Proteobacteria bacterium]|nr:YceI family protein [Pseudomonadota bacterium]
MEVTAARPSIPGVVAAFVAAVAALAFGTPTHADPAVRTLQPGDAHVHFSLPAFGWTRLEGDFPRVTGTVGVDEAARTAAVDLAADVAAVDAGAAWRNAFLRSETVFDAARFPLIRFHSTSARFEHGALRTVAGVLALHGVEHEVEWTVAPTACVAGPGCPLRATLTLHRADYAMDYGQPLVGDEVELEFVLERR